MTLMAGTPINPVLQKIRQALGRTHPLSDPPIPPPIDEPITRLVHSEIGLSELFAGRARANQMDVELLRIEDLHARVIAFLQASHCQRVAIPVSPFLDKLGVFAALRQAGLDIRSWSDTSVDELYEFDASITDVYCAVAETGSLVMRASPGHGRTLSLVPPVHIAILQPKDFLPDLVDLFERLSHEPVPSSLVLITGPSKTSDIELTLVTGVHGPMQVKLFILQ